MTALPGFAAAADHALPLHTVTSDGYADWAATANDRPQGSRYKKGGEGGAPTMQKRCGSTPSLRMIRS